MNISTLRPGLLVSLKTSMRGNVSYIKETIESEHVVETGAAKARWETERTIADPQEWERACKLRSWGRQKIASVCANSAFGLLCPEAEADKLEAAVREARDGIEAFNATATMTRVNLYVITGRVAPDDVEAVRAINSEVRDLMADMAEGLRNLDVSVVREAANKAKSIGAMLSPVAQERVQIAVEAARKSARQIVKAGEAAAVEIDSATIRQINEQRLAFLDLEEAAEVQAPVADARAIDLAPEEDEGGYDLRSYNDDGSLAEVTEVQAPEAAIDLAPNAEIGAVAPAMPLFEF